MRATARPANTAPPTHGEIAARRLIRGHLDTDGLDPVTAEAVQLLAAADLVAAEQYHAQYNMRRARRFVRNPAYLTLVLGMVCLLLVSWQSARLLQVSKTGTAQRHTLEKLVIENQQLTQQIASCVTPRGECAKRGQASQAAAVAVIVTRITENGCRIAFPDDAAAAARCIAQSVNARR